MFNNIIFYTNGNLPRYVYIHKVLQKRFESNWQFKILVNPSIIIGTITSQSLLQTRKIMMCIRDGFVYISQFVSRRNLNMTWKGVNFDLRLGKLFWTQYNNLFFFMNSGL